MRYDGIMFGTDGMLDSERDQQSSYGHSGTIDFQVLGMGMGMLGKSTRIYTTSMSN